jgi:hypothetical protein
MKKVQEGNKDAVTVEIPSLHVAVGIRMRDYLLRM